MIPTLIHLLKSPVATQRDLFPDIPEFSRGLPCLTSNRCQADAGCKACVESCPTDAITVAPTEGNGAVSLDLGRCIACGECMTVCPTGTISANRRTKVATRSREALILSNQIGRREPVDRPPASPFRRSIHLREVSTGDNASDLEVAAANNPIFDSSRFGIHFVASPRFADALIVTGPVGKAMQEPLRRCYEAMAEPRLVIAVGASAISGVPHCGSYAEANGVDAILPVAVYVPGHPSHSWYILHGILLAMGYPAAEITSKESG